MSEKIIREIYSQDRKRRVCIVQRENGSFGFEEEYFSDDPFEMSWCRYGQYPLAICDSEETALREAMGRVKWLHLAE